MNDILTNIIAFLEKVNSLALRVKLKTYSDRSQGIRHPDAPTGVGYSADGIAHMYAGGSSVAISPQGQILVTGNKTSIVGTELNLQADSYNDITICGKRINGSVIQGVFAQVPNAEALKTVQVITPITAVVGSKIVNTQPLSELIATGELLSSNKSAAKMVKTSNILGALTGEVPKIMKRLSK